MQETLGLEVAFGQVFVISTNEYVGAKENRAEFFEDFSDAESFLVAGWIALLSRREFARRQQVGEYRCEADR